MDNNSIIILMITICLGIMALMIMAKPLKFFAKIIFNGVLGAGGLYIANFVFGYFGLNIGINLLTTGFIGILGIPGFISLLFIGSIL